MKYTVGNVPQDYGDASIREGVTVYPYTGDDHGLAKAETKRYGEKFISVSRFPDGSRWCVCMPERFLKRRLMDRIKDFVNKCPQGENP